MKDKKQFLLTLVLALIFYVLIDAYLFPSIGRLLCQEIIRC
jgi:hypothetical protein